MSCGSPRLKPVKCSNVIPVPEPALVFEGYKGVCLATSGLRCPTFESDDRSAVALALEAHCVEKNHARGWSRIEGVWRLAAPRTIEEDA